MSHLKLASQLVLVLVVVLLPNSYSSVISKPAQPDDISVKPVEPILIGVGKPIPEYNFYFKNLTQEEQIGLMTLAIYYYDSDIEGAVPVPIATLPVVGRSPAGTKLPITNLEVPKSVYAHLLNGNIPSEWQREFTRWLKKEYKLKTKHFEQFKMTQSFCTEGDSSCPKLDNIGGSCCPFG